MNVYVTIIKYLLNTNYYNKYYNILNINNIKYNNKNLYKILLSLKELKEKHPKDVHSVDDLAAMYHSCYPSLQSVDAEYLEQTLTLVNAVSVDESVAESLFLSLAQQAKAEAIAAKAIEVSQGRGDYADLQNLMSDPVASAKDDETFANTDIGEIYNGEDSRGGLRWRLRTLNKVLGPITLGDFGFITARPEIGKTTFLASEVTFLGTQTSEPILWVNNEQRSSAVIPRCYSALLGKTDAEIRANLPDARAAWDAAFGDRFKFLDNPTVNRKSIEVLCDKYRPGLIVFDQLDKVAGFDAERYDLIMKAKYQWARELAKKYGPVIGVCQAGGSAEGKKYLEMTDIDSSHTAKQGEADWIMGIGASKEDGFERMRYLSFMKNKLPEHPDKSPELRHAKLEVKINEPIARYEDKIKW